MITRIINGVECVYDEDAEEWSPYVRFNEVDMKPTQPRKRGEPQRTPSQIATLEAYGQYLDALVEEQELKEKRRRKRENPSAAKTFPSNMGQTIRAVT
jgi:hypothetical protein